MKFVPYKLYHIAMQNCGDIDPSYPALEYIADRFELNLEQRYWLAFLYQSTYCTPSVFYIWNEFPDYNLVNSQRLSKWWNCCKQNVYFQKDRAKVKNFDMLVPMFESYRNIVGENQNDFFTEQIHGLNPKEAYKKLYSVCGKVFYIGRFALFLWLENIHRLTKLNIHPTDLDLPNASTCRDGLLIALKRFELVGKNLTKQQYNELNHELDKIVEELSSEYNLPCDYWKVETSLCAYRKLYKNPPTRYLGYYIDRMQFEIQWQEERVPHGVDWEVLWQFREEFFDWNFLGEKQGWSGIRKEAMGVPSQELLIKALNCKFKEKVLFPGATQVYNGRNYARCIF